MITEDLFTIKLLILRFSDKFDQKKLTLSVSDKVWHLD